MIVNGVEFEYRYFLDWEPEEAAIGAKTIEELEQKFNEAIQYLRSFEATGKVFVNFEGGYQKNGCISIWTNDEQMAKEHGFEDFAKIIEEEDKR
ncbi:MAG: hypothetical protein KA369_08395 [Spirochaetes bacterium]|nr:hypothetical protein [Spirochaetota bacterium]